MTKRKEYAYICCFFERDGQDKNWKAWCSDVAWEAPHHKWYRIKIPVPDELLLDEVEAEEPVVILQ